MGSIILHGHYRSSRLIRYCTKDVLCRVGLSSECLELLGNGPEPFVVAVLVDEEILLPFRTRLGVVTKQDVIEPKAKQLLRRQERHTCLLRRAVAFPLVAFDARGHEVLRGVLAALCSRQNVVERQILCVTMVAAILA